MASIDSAADKDAVCTRYQQINHSNDSIHRTNGKWCVSPNKENRLQFVRAYTTGADVCSQLVANGKTRCLDMFGQMSLDKSKEVVANLAGYSFSTIFGALGGGISLAVAWNHMGMAMIDHEPYVTNVGDSLYMQGYEGLKGVCGFALGLVGGALGLTLGTVMGGISGCQSYHANQSFLPAMKGCWDSGFMPSLGTGQKKECVSSDFAPPLETGCEAADYHDYHDCREYPYPGEGNVQ